MVSRHLIVPSFAPCHLLGSAAGRWRGVVGGLTTLYSDSEVLTETELLLTSRSFIQTSAGSEVIFGPQQHMVLFFPSLKDLYNKNLCLGTYREESIHNLDKIHKITALKKALLFSRRMKSHSSPVISSGVKWRKSGHWLLAF